MSIDRLINLLATVTLIQMMATIGLAVTVREVLAVVVDRRLLLKAVLANYLLVPAAVVGLLLLYRAAPMVAVGFLVPAVCPGAPYGPAFTALARGSVGVSVGLMVILAASSAIVAPLLLGLLIPWMTGGEAAGIDTAAMVVTLLTTQLLPLGLGLYVTARFPAVADRLKRPMARTGTVLNLLLLGVILAAQFPTLLQIRLSGYAGMVALVAASALAGWLLGGPASPTRRSLALTSSVRNVGVGLVIVTGSFAGTAAVTATMAYGLLQTVLMALAAWGWGRYPPAPAPSAGSNG